jgi:hypothetical protein
MYDPRVSEGVAQGGVSLKRFAVLAAGAFAVRALFLVAVGSDPRSFLSNDSPSYVRSAANLARHGSFSQSESPPLVPDTVRTPGYPLFLAPFCLGEPRLWAAVWAQAAVGALASGLAYAAGVLAGAGPTAGLWAGVLMAIDPVATFHCGQVLSDTCFVTVFLAAFCLLALAVREASPGRAAVAGASFGVAALVRPAGLYFFLAAAPLAGWLCWGAPGRRRAAPLALALALAVFAAAPPLTWALRNARQAGVFAVSTIEGINLLLWRGASIDAAARGVPFEEAHRELEAQLRAGLPPGASPAEEARAYRRDGLRLILGHPATLARLCAVETVKMMGGHGMEMAAWMLLKDPDYDPTRPEPPHRPFGVTLALAQRHPLLGVAAAAYMLGLAVVYALALIGAWKLFRMRPAAAALLAAPVVYFTAVHCLAAVPYHRFRLPFYPFVLLFAGAGAERLRRRA